MRPELNIPNRDRRARRRILTLKNARFVVLGFVLLTVALVLYARRRGDNGGDYGRLFGKQVAQPQVEASRRPDIITEAPVPDQTAADPMLVAPAAREQYLGVDQQSATARQSPVAIPVMSAPAAAAIQPGDHVSIVGDEHGVSLARTAGAATPKLTGGFGKPQEVVPPPNH